MATRKEVFREHLQQYLEASKQEKGEILDGLEKTLKMHRKAVVRSLNREMRRDTSTQHKKPGRRVVYDKRVTVALKQIWKISGEICAERLHDILGEYVRILTHDKMWTHDRVTTEMLCAMSMGTMKARIRGFSRSTAGKGISTTKPSNLKEIIPVRRGPWEDPEPGFGEIDTVVHSGTALAGAMAYTVNFTDITTGWVESAAQIGKGEEPTLASIKDIRNRLPFPLLGLDPDSGSEFINWHLKGWCDEETIELTRSRPNHKNDNAHIEQKNYAAVRKFLGYGRIDDPRAVVLMRKLYAGPHRLYINFFQPSMRCIGKVKVGSRYVRKYDVAKTPYQRVLEHRDVDQEVKNELTRIYATLNPLVLRREIDGLIRAIFKAQRHGNT